MKRYDLRHLKEDFLSRMLELAKKTKSNEACIFLFEINDFEAIQESINLLKENGCEIINSLKFNEVDWTIIIKKI